MSLALRKTLSKILWAITQNNAKSDLLTYRRLTESIFDPVSQTTETGFEVTAIRGLIGPKPRTGFAPAVAEVTVIMAERALDHEPVLGDQVVWQGLTYQVTSVERIYLGAGYSLTGQAL